VIRRLNPEVHKRMMRNFVLNEICSRMLRSEKNDIMVMAK
jgi:hypothetical protein